MSRLARIYAEQYKWSAAVREYAKLIELKPTMEDAYLGIAEAYRWRTEYDSAIDYLNRGLARVAHTRKQPLDLVAATELLLEEGQIGLAEAGARILPLMPSFSGRPRTVDDLVDGLVMRALDLLGLRVDLAPRWRGPDAR